MLFTRPLGQLGLRSSANNARVSGDAFNRKSRAKNGTKLKLSIRNRNILAAIFFRGKFGLKLSLFGQFLFLSALLWLSLKSKTNSYVQEDKRNLPGNVCISSELAILPSKQCCIWISTRDVLQIKFNMPTKCVHVMEFRINRKNKHLLLFILLSGDIATNPGPATRISNLCRPFSVFYQNVRSLKSTYYSRNTKENKLSSFHDIVSTNQFDVIALTETWLDSSVSNHELLPSGYKISRRDRERKRGGGVVLAVKDSIKTEPFKFTSSSLELVGIVIKSLSNSFLVCVSYRPPNAGPEFLQEFSRFLKCADVSRYKDIIILGDFNYPSIHWLDGSGFSDITTDRGFTDILQEAGLFQLVNSPTRGQNILDLLLTTNVYLIDNITVTDDDSTCVKSDHKAITSDINLIRKVSKPVKRMVYNYKNGDFDSLRATLRCLPLLALLESEADIDSAWTKWKDLFLSAVDAHIPKTKVKISYKPPYITKDIIHALNMKETIRKRAKSTNSPSLWDRFRELRRKIKSMIRSKKREYISTLASSVKNKPKEFWRFFKAKTTGSSLPDTLTLNDDQFTTSESKADAFNKYFASTFHPSAPSSSNVGSSICDEDTLKSISVSTEETSYLLSNLSTDKATGRDEISARLLKECSNEIAPSLTALFNKSLTLGKVPQEWKEANVVPVPKKGDVHEVSNYRPISLLSLVSKLLEQVVHLHVSEFVESSLSNLQHGFRKRRLCHPTSWCFPRRW